MLKRLYPSYHSNVTDTLRTTRRSVKTNSYLLYGAFFFLNLIYINYYKGTCFITSINFCISNYDWCFQTLLSHGFIPCLNPITPSYVLSETNALNQWFILPTLLLLLWLMATDSCSDHRPAVSSVQFIFYVMLSFNLLSLIFVSSIVFEKLFCTKSNMNTNKKSEPKVNSFKEMKNVLNLHSWNEVVIYL